MTLSKLEQQVYNLSKEGVTCDELLSKMSISKQELLNVIIHLINLRLLITKKQVGKALVFIQNNQI